MRLSILLLLLPFLFPRLSLSYQSLDPHNINQIDFLPSIRFNVHSTSNDIELQNINFPSKAILKFLLSNMELLSTEKNFIVQQIVNAGETVFSRSVTFSHVRDSTVKFSQLNGGHTYYLYYLLLDESDSIIGPYMEVISTSQPFIISTIFWTLNPSIFTDVLIPILLFAVVIMLIRKFEEKCGKSEPKKETSCCLKETRNALYLLRPEFKLPLQTVQQQDPLLLAKETAAKAYQTFTNINLQQEKNEVQRVIKRLEEENKEFEDRLMCEICCEKFREVIFLSCGHVYCCEKCAVELIVCPIDKSIIGSKFRFAMCDKYGIDVQLSPQIIASKLQSLDLLKFNYNNSNALKAQEPTQMEKYLGLRIKNENYKLFSHCIICNERKKNVLFVQCQHLICCHICAKDMKVCPLDGRSIFQKTHVFTA